MKARGRPAAPDDRRSGWAHFERVGPAEVRFVEWCADGHGPHGDCGTRLAHGYRGGPERVRAVRERLRPVDVERFR